MRFAFVLLLGAFVGMSTEPATAISSGELLPSCLDRARLLGGRGRAGLGCPQRESGSPAHVKENAVALSLTLTTQELQTLDAAFPGPSRPN